VRSFWSVEPFDAYRTNHRWRVLTSRALRARARRDRHNHQRVAADRSGALNDLLAHLALDAVCACEGLEDAALSVRAIRWAIDELRRGAMSSVGDEGEVVDVVVRANAPGAERDAGRDYERYAESMLQWSRSLGCRTCDGLCIMPSTPTRLLLAVGAAALQACGGSDSSSSLPSDSGVDSTTTSVGDAAPDSRIDPSKKCYFTGDLIVDGVTREFERAAARLDPRTRASSCSE